MKLNEIMAERKDMEARLVNVCVEETNFLCHWMDEDCILRQDWNLQLNSSNKILMCNKFFLF